MGIRQGLLSRVKFAAVTIAQRLGGIPTQAQIDTWGRVDEAHRAYLQSLATDVRAGSADRATHGSYMNDFLAGKQRRGHGYRMPRFEMRR